MDVRPKDQGCPLVEGGAAPPRLGPASKGVGERSYCRSARGNPRSGEPVVEGGTDARLARLAGQAATWARGPSVARATAQLASVAPARGRGSRICWPPVDDPSRGGGHRAPVRGALPPQPCSQAAPTAPMVVPEDRSGRSRTRRQEPPSVAAKDLAGDQKKSPKKSRERSSSSTRAPSTSPRSPPTRGAHVDSRSNCEARGTAPTCRSSGR